MNMTEIEARGKIKYRIANEMRKYGENKEEYEDLEIAIQALEKQVPKKPDYEGDGYADGELVYDYAKCPMCGHWFEYGINDWESNYCSDCGQKLDWQ